MINWNRRDVLAAAAALGVLPGASFASESRNMLSKHIPASDETLPVIGLGTYIISHPAVTGVIPATSKAHHMIDNLGAGMGPLPDSTIRRRMSDFFTSI